MNLCLPSLAPRAAPCASLGIALLLTAACRPPPLVESLPIAAEPERPEPVVVDESDGNDSLATAVPLPLDDEAGAREVFQRPGDVDTFVVEVPEPRVLQVRVVGNILGWAGGPDPRLELRDEAGTLLAENDVDQLQLGLDPLAVLQFGPGRLYVEVTEAQGLGDGTFGYTVLAETVTRGLELEPNDTRAQATDVADTLGFSGPADNDEELVAVAVVGAGDADWFRLPVATADTRFYLSISRRTESSPSASFSVFDVAGALVARSVPGDSAESAARAVVWPSGGEMFVEVTSDAEPQAVLVRALPSQRLTEQEQRGVAGQNDELATADPLPSAFPFVLTSDLSAAGDIDRFQVASAGDYTIVCSSKLHGSGVLGLTLEARDDADAPLADPMVEDDSGSPASFRVTAAGPFQYRMSKQGQDTENLGGTVNCTLFRFQ